MLLRILQVIFRKIFQSTHLAAPLVSYAAKSSTVGDLEGVTRLGKLRFAPRQKIAREWARLKFLKSFRAEPVVEI